MDARERIATAAIQGFCAAYGYICDSFDQEEGDAASPEEVAGFMAYMACRVADALMMELTRDSME